MNSRVRVLVFAVLAMSASSYAQGLGVYEHSACSMARAAAADPFDDGSAIVDNPAAVVGAKGLTMGGGGLLAAGRSTFRSDDGRQSKLEQALSPVPFGSSVMDCPRSWRSALACTRRTAWASNGRSISPDASSASIRR